jgi:hypothetical protein
MAAAKEPKSLQTQIVSRFVQIPFIYKLTFFTTFCIGFLSNLFVFTNNLVNHDTLNEGYQNLGFIFLLEQGRWLQYAVRLIGNLYPSPVTHGLFGLILLSLSAALIVKIFHLEDRLSAILLSALLGVFPINACFYSYMYMADVFYVSMFFAVLAVALSVQGGKRNFLFASVSLMCSVAVYQAFISTAIALIVAVYFLELLHADHFQLKKWFLSAVRDTLMVAAGYVLYGLITNILLYLTGASLRSYGGTADSFSISLENIPLSIAITRIDIKTFYFSTVWIQHKVFLIANLIMAFIFIAVMLWTLYRYARMKKYGMMIICLAYDIVMPFLIDNIYIIMNLRGTVHMLMHYVYIIPYILLIVLLPELFTLFHSNMEKYKNICKRMANALTSLGLVCMVIVTYICFIISNQLYCRMSNNITATNASLTAMMSRIESIDGWDLSKPVFIANANATLNSNLQADLSFYNQISGTLWTGTDVYPWSGNNQIYNYLSYYFNIDLTEPTQEQADAILSSEEFEQMPVYPAEGSIRVINDIVVVKMEES